MGFIIPGTPVWGLQTSGEGGVTLIAPIEPMPAPVEAIIGLSLLMRGPMFSGAPSSSSVMIGPRPLTIFPS